MGRVNITESELNRLISESIQRVLTEDVDEGLRDRLRAMFNGAKAGYESQKTLDRGVDDYKQQHDFDDTRSVMDNPLKKMPKTAEEAARDAYNQYKSYQQQANKMLNLYNSLCKKYGLAKAGVGDFRSTAPAPKSSGVNFTPTPEPHFGRTTGSRQAGTAPTGLWGK